MSTQLQSGVEVSLRVSPFQARQIEEISGTWGEMVYTGKTVRTLRVFDVDAAIAALAARRDALQAEVAADRFEAQPGANSITALIRKVVGRMGPQAVPEEYRRWL